MNKSRKLLLGIGSITMLATSTISTISCGSRNNDAKPKPPEPPEPPEPTKLPKLTNAEFEKTQNETLVTIAGENLDLLKKENLLISKKNDSSSKIDSFTISSQEKSKLVISLINLNTSINLAEYKLSIVNYDGITEESSVELIEKPADNSPTFKYSSVSKSLSSGTTFEIVGENLGDIKSEDILVTKKTRKGKKSTSLNINWKIEVTPEKITLNADPKQNVEYGQYIVSVTNLKLSIDVSFSKPKFTQTSFSRNGDSIRIILSGNNLGIVDVKDIDIVEKIGEPSLLEGFEVFRELENIIFSASDPGETKFPPNKFFFVVWKVDETISAILQT